MSCSISAFELRLVLSVCSRRIVRTEKGVVDMAVMREPLSASEREVKLGVSS
jgi:hypothetical protein